MIPACRAFGLGVLVWSPLAGGLLSGKYRRGQDAPEGSRMAIWKDQMGKRSTERVWNVIDLLVKLGEERSATGKPATAAQVALAWLLAKPETSSVIVGAKTVAQLDDNLKALDVKLTAEDVAALDAASLPDWGYPYDMIHRSQRW